MRESVTSLPDRIRRLHFPDNKRLGLIVPLLILIAIAAAYTNSLQNGFQLDDWHVLTKNIWIRDLANIPNFFTDPFTFSVLAPNIGYRPVLQITYALNYAISGYDLWSWHLLQLALHAGVAISLFFFGRILIGRNRIVRVPGITAREGDLAAMVAAIVYAVHPITTECANYFSARSSLLVAFWALPSILLYIRALRGGPTWRQIAASLLLFILALFTKVEAISLLAMYMLAEYLLAPEVQGMAWRRRLLRISPLRRLLPFLVAAMLYLILYKNIMPDFVWATRQAGDMTPYHYLLTQLKAWWYYIGELLAPVNLIADTLSYPVSTSLLDPHVLFAATGWLIVFALMLSWVNRAPSLVFLACGFFVYLAPHSSFVPLAEMVNEHRPYLPLAHIAMLISVGGYCAIRAATRQWAIPAWLIVGLLLAISLGAMTVERNGVWKNNTTFWADIVRKAPTSSRAQMNYGLTFLASGNLVEAEKRFRETVRLAPSYSYGRINLAITLEMQGKTTEAEQEYNLAVKFEDMVGVDGQAHYRRGIFLLRTNRPEQAIADLEIAVKRIGQPVHVLSSLAEAYARLGHAPKAWAATQNAVQLDPGQTSALITRIGTVFWNGKRYVEGSDFYQLAAKELPGKAWIWESLGNFYAAIPKPQKAAEAYRRDLAINPDNKGAQASLARMQHLINRQP